MKRTSAVVVMTAMIFSNCAARGPALRLDRTLTRPATAEDPSGSGTPTPGQDAQIWRQYAERLPIGSLVRVRTTSGGRLTAVLMTVDDSGVTVKPKTRIPEAAQHIPFDSLDQLEITRDGSNIAKSAVIGGAVGAGVFLGMLMLLFASLD